MRRCERCDAPAIPERVITYWEDALSAYDPRYNSALELLTLAWEQAWSVFDLEARKTQISPEMTQAGVETLLAFGPEEDFRATDPALIVRQVFQAMLDAGQPARAPSALPLHRSE